MKLEILQLPDCPNAAVLQSRLTQLLAGHPGAEVIQRIVTSEDQARLLGMTGSPTLLIDGTDPFARPGQQPALACRLYTDDHGRPAAAPSASQLRQALQSRPSLKTTSAFWPPRIQDHSA
ncbi:MAG TPA: thioredoxin family protein [Streptosporangiaceae bacterium]|jgi:hypothetical protein